MNIFSSPTTKAQGLAGNLSSLLQAAGDYLDARAQLLLVESRDASRTASLAAVLAAAAVFSLGMAYLAAWVVIIIWTADHWWNHHLLHAILCAAGLHLAFTLLLAAAVARTLRGSRFFPATRREFQADHQWLACHQKPGE